jgi:mono/diheme cytochrome c family protein
MTTGENKRSTLFQYAVMMGTVVLVYWAWWLWPWGSIENGWADSPSPTSQTLKGTVAKGREIFNGNGACHFCHGIDGYLGRTARLEPKAAELIAKLNPPPSDLRNVAGLRLKTNRERARTIREGHAGSNLLSQQTMTDQDIADLLMYLAFLRKDPNPMAD